jgi:hypothetical protein
VIDAATAVFLDRGYGAATVRAIAAEAKVSVPTVEAGQGAVAQFVPPHSDEIVVGVG